MEDNRLTEAYFSMILVLSAMIQPTYMETVGVYSDVSQIWVVPRLHPDHLWDPGSRPPKQLLERLPDVEGEHPDQEHPPPHHAVHIPDEEAVEQGVGHLLAQESPEFEQVIPKFIVHLK